MSSIISTKSYVVALCWDWEITVNECQLGFQKYLTGNHSLEDDPRRWKHVEYNHVLVQTEAEQSIATIEVWIWSFNHSTIPGYHRYTQETGPVWSHNLLLSNCATQGGTVCSPCSYTPPRNHFWIKYYRRNWIGKGKNPVPQTNECLDTRKMLVLFSGIWKI